MRKAKKIWLDGRIINWNHARVHILTNALHYGSGVFEGIRCYETEKGGAVFRLDDHIKRLFYSAQCLGIEVPYTPDKLKKAVLSLIGANKIRECYIRPIAFCGYDRLGLDIVGSSVGTAIVLWPWEVYLGDKGLSAVISRYKRLSPMSVPIDAKINGYYVNSIIATSEAKNKGADEAILLDDDGYIAEGAGENVFIVKNNKIYTPSPGAILPGITRSSVITIAGDVGLKIVEKKISVKNLMDADEIFFTGTAVEVCSVTRVNGSKIGDGAVGRITSKIKEDYGKIVRGNNNKYKKWLTLV